jgi:hypothetical protein
VVGLTSRGEEKVGYSSPDIIYERLTIRLHIMKAQSATRCAKIAFILVIVASFCIPLSADSSSDATTLSEAERLQLAEQYAPVLQYVNGEPCYPVEVDYYLQTCSLYQVTNQTAVLISENPTIPELSFLRTDDYFLDNRLGSVDDDDIVQAYQQNLTQLGYTVYFHVDGDGSTTYIQYWMFYVFNPGSVNQHEGDWEMVQIVLDTNLQPVATTYSQHHTAVKATWSDVLIQDATHAIAYVALGSHANYYRYYQGKIQGADTCGDDGLTLRPSEYALIEIQQDIPGGDPDTSWVWYAGRWGTIPDILADARGDAGPQGPMYREGGSMWDGLAFYNDAKELSTSTLWLEFLLYYLTWIILAFAALAVVLTARRVYKMQKSGELKFPYFEILNLKAKGFRGKANILALIGLAIAIAGLMYPVFTMEIWVLEGDYATNGFVTLLSLGGTDLFVLNTLDPSGEVVNVGNLAVNFALILGLMVFLFVLNNLAVSAKRASKKYIGFGITLTIIFVIFFIVVISLGPLAAAISPPEGGGLVELLEYVSQHPFGGSASLNNPTFGQVELRWGFDWGTLLLAAGIALITAGLVMRSAVKTEGK